MGRAFTPVVLAVIALGVGGSAASGAAHRPLARAHDFRAAVPLPGAGRAPLSADAAAAGPLTTPPLRAPRRFDLLGFHWRAPAHLTIHVRVRRAGGRWSPWVSADDAANHGAPRTTDPVWTGAADLYQVRTSRPAAGLRAHFVQVPHVPMPQARARAAANGAPTIIPRSEWDPDHQCDPTHAPTYGRVDMAFVHHTVSANDYAPGESASIVLAICRYHIHANGWWDIGYNFLVDRYGNVFEGRAGGVEKPVVGAQAQGYNSVSTGVSNIGTFQTAGQTNAGLHALARLIGWKLALHGDPVRGRVAETSGGGADNRYPAGTRVTLHRIAGHRDGDATECPGAALYAQLPTIRRLAAATARTVRAHPILTGTAPATVFGATTPVPFTGRLALPPGDAAAGQAIALQRAGTRGWVTVAASAARADGSWAITVLPRYNGRFRALWAGDALHAATASAPFALRVRPVLRLRARSAHIPPGGRAVLAGTIVPAKGRVIVRVARRIRPRVYLRLARFVVAAPHGAFGLRVTLTRAGLYRFIASTAADATNAAGASPRLYVRAAGPRVIR
jgi:N-acetylmuramoyl-L-alanine amidase